MKIRTIIITFFIVAINSCGVIRRSASDDKESFNSFPELKEFCDSSNAYSSLFISRISSEFVIEDELYNAKLSIYYIPDSIFFLTAANKGFEIVRLLMAKDSVIIVNRLEKLVYSYKNENTKFDNPVNFQDIEYLINKPLVCAELGRSQLFENRIFINRSVQDIRKAIYYRVNDLSIDQFEFFNKKTNRYIVGEINNKNELLVFSNFILDDIRITAHGGQLEFNREIDASIRINRRKYITIEL